MIKWINQIFIMLFLAATSLSAQVVRDSSLELNRIDIEEHLGGYIPLDLPFVDDSGKNVLIGDYFGKGKPVILILGYYECPMLCNLVFNGMADGVKELGWKPGEKYQILTASINPKEKYQLAYAKKINYLKSIGDNIDPSGWTFLTTSDLSSKTLADAIGFKYFYDSTRQEYAHAAAAFILTDEGKISRYLYGINFSKTDLKLSLLEASKGKVGNTIDRLILYCFHYDPDSRGFVVVAGNVMKLGGVVTLFVLILLLSILWYGDRRQKKHRAVALSKSPVKMK